MKLGAIWRYPQPQDDRAGAQSRVVYEDRGVDWEMDVPKDGEIQVSLYTETNSCTNHSCSNSIDTQVNYFIGKSLIPEVDLQRLTTVGFIVNGKFNTSEAWNAVKSQTDPKFGNYLYKPWDSARNDGMIPDNLIPFGRYSILSDFYGFTETQEMRDAAALFKEIFLIQYEIIPTDKTSLIYHICHAPISIISGVCPPWSTGVIPACPLDRGHATLLYGESPENYWNDFDSYTPNEKKLAWDYKISYGIKGVVTLRSKQEELHYVWNDNMEGGDTSEEIKMLQIALFLDGKDDGTFADSEWDTREKIQKFGGYFGSATLDNVRRFQTKYHLPVTGLVGPLTRAKLNLLFN